MKLDANYSYPADIEKVYGLITSQGFRDEACGLQGALEHEVTVEEQSNGGHTVTIKRTMPADMPDFIKKLTGETVKVVQVEAWGPADKSGKRTAEVKVDIIGQPASMRGTGTLASTGSSTAFDLHGNVKVAIPLIGKRIEPEVAKAIVASLDADVEYGKTKL